MICTNRKEANSVLADNNSDGIQKRIANMK